MGDIKNWQCPVCKRVTPIYLQEDHHLIPKSKKGKETILLCIDCARQLHKLFTNKELAQLYNTLEKILASSKIQNWIQWIWKRPFGITMSTKKAR